MSRISQAEASKPLQKKMQECKRCKTTGFPNQMIGFEKVREDANTGKIIWKLIDDNGREHTHKHIQDLPIDNTMRPSATLFKRRRVVDIAAITDVSEAKKLLASGWEYKTSYPATIANIPHYVLVKRE